MTLGDVYRQRLNAQHLNHPAMRDGEIRPTDQSEVVALLLGRINVLTDLLLELADQIDVED